MQSITTHKQKTKSSVDFRITEDATSSATFEFLSGIDSPRSLTVWLLYNTGEHDQLTALACIPSDYLDVYKFRDDYAATKFLSKSAFLKTTFDKKDVALEKFQQYESLCRETNYRFRNKHLDPLFIGPNVSLLDATRRKIAQILGSFSPDEFVESANWGKGVTTKLKGSYVSAINKFHLENGITQSLHSLVSPWFNKAYPVWGQHLEHLYGASGVFLMQSGNTVITVPKDSKTDRVIAVEPGINLWFQKSIGTMIRRRLLRRSIDLNTQATNQCLARLSSIDGSLATVDFSSASDSISLEVVRELIPERWFFLMDACRSKFGVSTTNAHWWEKFSSMGNGFTFELESLIFYASALAVRDYYKLAGPISVYGDDVIIPTDMLNPFSSFCSFLGFRVNHQKTFSDGYFRESCGSHYWRGIDVKPIFLKERVKNVQAVYKLANSIRMLSHRRNNYFGCDGIFLHAWRSLVRRVPKPLRLYIPSSLGDVGFITNFDEATPSRARHGIEGYRVKTLTAVGLTDFLDSPAVLLARLWSPSVLEYGNTYTLRGRTKLRRKTVLVKQWCDLGPWI